MAGVNTSREHKSVFVYQGGEIRFYIENVVIKYFIAKYLPE